MKWLFDSRAGWASTFRILCLAGAICVPQTSRAWEYELEDGNSKVVITADSLEGMKDWCVDGVNQLFRQWFWYRVGNTGKERPINTLGLANPQLIGNNSLYAEYGGTQFRIEVTFTLLGGADGSGQSSIGEQIRIKNLTTSPLNFHFFQYTDFDLAGSGPGDTVQLYQDSMGLFNEAVQVKGNIRFADTIVSPGANHGEAGIATATNSLSVRLNDNSPTTLSDFVGPQSGDVDWALQWDRMIAPGGYLNIYINKESFVLAIPEPSVFGLVPMGVIALGIARRFRGKRH